MSNLLDKQINQLIHLITKLDFEHIYNYYDPKGANPGKIITNNDGKKEIIPYSPSRDTFAMFGVEDIESERDYIVTPEAGGPQGKIIITHKVKITVEFVGKKAQDLALKFKALMWSREAMDYLESEKIDIITQNPSVNFLDEIINEQLWNIRNIVFDADIELWYDSDSSPDMTQVSDDMHIIDITKEDNQ